MNHVRTLGLDIGGANLKASDGLTQSITVPFPLWKQPDELYNALGHLRNRFEGSFEQIAVTMTGELADCYATKAEGVQHIANQAREAFPSKHVVYYAMPGDWLTCEEVRERWADLAAANWRVLSQFVANEFFRDRSGLLLDIGTTTTDCIPIANRRVIAVGKSDTQRLLAGELIYSGVVRTPLCSFVDTAPYRGQDCPIANEFFASTGDVYVWLGSIPERSFDAFAADGKPSTREYSLPRLARMIAADASEFHAEDATKMALRLAESHWNSIRDRVLAVVESHFEREPIHVVVSGIGEFLAVEVAKSIPCIASIRSFREKFGESASACAPAFALARLASGVDHEA